MNNEKMAGFIAELRKTKGMTQKELAEKLNVTDKAVSKWERGLSYPDVSLLNSLSSILGVSTNELLSGEKSTVDIQDTEAVVETTLRYVDSEQKSKLKKIRAMSGMILSAVFFLGIVVCIICDMAISGRLTWSLYPICSIIYAWLLIYPMIRCEKRGVVLSLVSLTIFTLPYLYILYRIIGSYEELITMGKWITVIAVTYLWMVFALFQVLKRKILTASAIASLLAIPISLVISFIVSRYINEAIIDVWDALTWSILIILAIVLFSMDRLKLKHN